MLERLIVAEYVIADLTLANPNVMYEVGVRHGASPQATLLLCAQPLVGKLPLDFKTAADDCLRFSRRWFAERRLR
jgi:hypothetical protein